MRATSPVWSGMCICFMIPLSMNLLGKSLCGAFSLLYLQSSAVSRMETRVTYRRQQRKAGGVSCAFLCFGSQQELGYFFGSSEGRDIPAGSLLALHFLLHPFPGSSDPPSEHSQPSKVPHSTHHPWLGLLCTYLGTQFQRSHFLKL